MRIERRIQKDWRRETTPPLSRYTFFGRRRYFHRKTDREKGGYVDHCSSKPLLLLVSLAVLNILDCVFTMAILDWGDVEVNPIVGPIIELYGGNFWVWKYGLHSACLILLVLHIQFRLIKTALIGILHFYAGVVLYQIYMILSRQEE